MRGAEGGFHAGNMLLKQQRELMAEGLVNKDQLTEAMHSDTGKKSGTLQALLDMSGVDGEAVLIALARSYKVPYLDIRSFAVNEEAIELCPEQLCLDFAFLPLDIQGKDLIIATDNPVDFNMLDTLHHKLGKRIKPIFARPDLIASKIHEVYQHTAADTARQALDHSHKHEQGSPSSTTENSEINVEDLRRSAEEPSIVRLVNGIIIQAMKVGSPDIRIEPGKQQSIVSLRVDGKLHPSLKFPTKAHQPVAIRFKMMSRLDLADMNSPQEGRTHIKLWNKRYEMCVSTQMEAHGEKVVIQILDKTQEKIRQAGRPAETPGQQDTATRQVSHDSQQGEGKTSSEAKAGDKPLILVVDDSSSVRNLVKFVLESDGYATAEAADGREAWDMVQRIHPSLVVADCDMPEMTGPELVRAMREQPQFNDTPIVLLTSKRDEKDEVFGLEVGADDYIGKPVEPLKLQARIKKTLAMYARIRQAMQGE